MGAANEGFFPVCTYVDGTDAVQVVLSACINRLTDQGNLPELAGVYAQSPCRPLPELLRRKTDGKGEILYAYHGIILCFVQLGRRLPALFFWGPGPLLLGRKKKYGGPPETRPHWGRSTAKI